MSATIKLKINRHVKQLPLPSKEAAKKFANDLYKRYKGMGTRKKAMFEKAITYALTFEDVREMVITDVISYNLYKDGGSLSVIFTTQKKQYEFAIPVDHVIEVDGMDVPVYTKACIHSPSAMEGEAVNITWQGAEILFERVFHWAGMEDMTDEDICIAAEIETQINARVKVENIQKPYKERGMM